MGIPLDEELRETPAQRRKRRLKKTALHILFAIVAYGLVVLLARVLHRRVLYQPPSADSTPTGSEAEALGESSELLARAADGTPVRALLFPAHEVAPDAKTRGRAAAARPAPPPSPKPAKKTVVHFHGNAENVEDNALLARDLAKHGLDVVLVEYRGYGKSRGASPTEDGLYLDAIAILDALAERGVGPERIVLFGQALGTGVAAEMAKRKRAGHLVLVAPFTSTLDLARRAMPVLPAAYVMVDRFDTLAKAPDIDIPTLVVHGDIDDVIPFELGERVARALPHAKLVKVHEGRHEGIYKGTTVVSDVVTHANE